VIAMSKSRSAFKRHRLAIGIVVAATVVLLSGVVAVAAGGPGDVRAQTAASSGQAPDQEIAKEIYDRARAYVGDGQGGIAGWIDPMQLGGRGDPKVYNDDGAQVGYWVDNLGFVDRATHDSPSYDPNALRVARLGADAVQEIDRLKAEFDACLETHSVPECAAQAGG
jgi:hypothetical protein